MSVTLIMRYIVGDKAGCYSSWLTAGLAAEARAGDAGDRPAPSCADGITFFKGETLAIRWLSSSRQYDQFGTRLYRRLCPAPRHARRTDAVQRRGVSHRPVSHV